MPLHESMRMAHNSLDNLRRVAGLAAAFLPMLGSPGRQFLIHWNIRIESKTQPSVCLNECCQICVPLRLILGVVP